jgi:SAM-dependent methyltransferase/uncharacterized protein YbaR (Trm112 family)
MKMSLDKNSLMFRETSTVNSTEEMLKELRCPRCRGELSLKGEDVTSNAGITGPAENILWCATCNELFPVISGIPRMLLSPLREALLGEGQVTGTDAQQVETAQSFGFEWQHFSEMYDEWKQTFLNYMTPHEPEFFAGKRVLDAGCGSGRFAFYAAKFGAKVWALDLGPTVEVAQRNNSVHREAVRVVQADLYHPPFALESFDFIYSLGVLHHLPFPEEAFQNLLRFLKPGGKIQIYLYWKPEGQPIKSAMLTAVNAARRITTRLPHKVLYKLSVPAALVGFVWPYRLLKRTPGLRNFAERLPMKQYAQYPFRVCVNDQFDRLSAPIENRYTKSEVEAWLERAGLEDIQVTANFGWLGTGRKPDNRSV